MTELNLEFWAALASAWDRSITAEEQTHVAETACQVAKQSLADLGRLGTVQQIPDALSAILDDGDDEDEDW